MSSWILAQDIIALVNNKNHKLYITRKGSKALFQAVERLKKRQKDIGSFIEMEIKNSFLVRLGDNMSVEVKNKDLPNDEWYTLRNELDSNENVWEMLTNVDNNRGNFGDVEFEIATSDLIKDRVVLVTPSMPSYQKLQNQMKRVLFYDIYSKTKKWTPGHRFYSKTSTYYCIAQVKSRRSGIDSVYLSKGDMVDAWIVTEELEGQKTCKEVLETKSFGPERGDLRIIYTAGLMVDDGEFLKNDIGDDIMTYYPKMVENAKKRFPTSQEVMGMRSFLDIFTVQSDGHEDLSQVDINLISDIKDRIKESMYITMIKNYNNYSSLRDKSKVEEGAESLLKFFYNGDNMMDGNSKRSLYYKLLFLDLGLDDPKDMAKKVIKDFDIKDITDNFNGYVNYAAKYLYNNFYSESITQRKTSSRYSMPFTKLGDKFGADLCDTIRKICSERDQCNGSNCDIYEVYNSGTRTAPKEWVTTTITLKDILNYFGENLANIPENLKLDIMKCKFREVELAYDKGEKLA